MFSLSVSVLKVLEKMRPLDQKLKYQIDKLVRTAVTGSLCKCFIYLFTHLITLLFFSLLLRTLIRNL